MRCRPAILFHLLVACLLSTATTTLAQLPAFPLAENTNFCSPGAPDVPSFPTWGTYCPGDENMAHAATQTFRLTGPFSIYLSGNPNGKDLTIRLENLSDHQSLDLHPNVGPGTLWLKFDFDLPASWRNKDLRIVADDHSTASMGWLAFSAPMPIAKGEALSETKKLLLKTALFTLLIFLPGFTLAAFALSRRIRGTLKLGLITLAGIAIPGYLLFFIYVLSPKVAYTISANLPYVCAALLLFLLWRLKPRERQRLLPFLVPVALTFFASLGILSLGFLYGGTDFPLLIAWDRFSHHLPPDNTLPYLLAEGLRHGVIPKPISADWLSSDRPPLQTGMVLALAPWMPFHRELWYQVSSVILQSLWTFALWLLLRAFRISHVTTALIIASIYISGFTIVNTFFVWPKLLAAAYLIAFAIPILAARRQPGRGTWLLRILMAFLLACSLLSHGGTLFALLGLLFYMLLHFRRQMLKQTLIVSVTTVVLYSPWIAYQKFVDPPGDRLIKYHLAGVEQVTPQPALPTILDAYRHLTFAQWLSNKEANTQTAFGHELEYVTQIPHFLNPASKAAIRALQFFFFLPCLAFVLFGAAGLLLRRKNSRVRNQTIAAQRLLLWALLTLPPWIILLFIPKMTIVHASAYAMELAATAGSILAFRSAAPRLAVAVCLIQCVFEWLLYQPDLTHLAFPESLNFAMNHWMLASHLLSLAAFAAVLALPLRSAKPQIISPRTAENLRISIGS